MDTLNKFVHKWEESLNQDAVLKRRIEHIQSALEEGREVLEVGIEKKGVFTISLEEKKFYLKSRKASKPLLSWKVPLPLFKQMLLGYERIVYALLDNECTLSFDTPHFTHWDGITALAVILTAQEMVKKDLAVKKLVEEL